MVDIPSMQWTVRIGQLTGTTGDRWRDLVDAQRWPLLIDTGHWGMVGVDLGANTEHSDGRLYFFFGDTAEIPPVPRNADLVAWTDDRAILRHGGHQRLGWTFHLPSEEAQHATDATGQGDWRFCATCHGLFFAPHGDATGTACPAGGPHVPLGWNFHLPSEEAQHATDATGQGAWRFCATCHGLFFDGYPTKGLCPGAPGGGIRLHAVLGADGNLDPFRAPEPFGVTESNETPTGAFSFGGSVYVFAGIGERRYTGKKRPVNPTYGNYLHSKARPDLPGEFRTEFLFSPRIGWCPTDASRTAFESHRVLGLRFVIQTGGTSGPGWRACRRCDSMFWDAPDQPSACHKGGRHEAKATTFIMPDGASDDQHQNLWCRCRNCATLFYDGFDSSKGLCPAGGEHVADEVAVVVAHATFDEDVDQQDHWRFCHKCGELFREDWSAPSVCPAGGAHDAMGFEFVLPHGMPEDAHHQRQWRCCGTCGGMFWMGAQATSHCPAGGGVHVPSTNPQSAQEFSLPHDLPPDATHQDQWQFCTKCAGMFFNGFEHFKGVCPADNGVHHGQGNNFVFAHNPGRDAFNEDGWRFCGRCFAMVDTKHPDVFAAAAACVVRNADHPHQLPQGISEWGVVLLGFGWVPGPKPASRIAWLPLHEGQSPRLTDTRYYGGDPERWSESPEDAVTVFEHDGFTSVSIAWLEGPRRWICLYSEANDVNRFDGPAVARIGTAPWEWSPPVPIFDPHAQGAYGVYMHKVGQDRIHPDLPPAQDIGARPEHDGWAYGAYLLNRFTEWNEAERELTITYLLSLSSPYQPQLMQTRLLVPR